MARHRRRIASGLGFGSTMGDTIAPVIGAGVIGSIGVATGAPASVTGPAMTGMNLLAVGNMAKIGMGIPRMMMGGRRRRSLW